MDFKTAREYYYRREQQRYAQREAERQEWLQRLREAIARIAPKYPDLQRVYLFGSLTRPGQFSPTSDIDIAVESDTVETESAFWQALEQKLKRDVDVRPLTGPIKEEATHFGEKVYERKNTRSD